MGVVAGWRGKGGRIVGSDQGERGHSLVLDFYRFSRLPYLRIPLQLTCVL